MLQITIPSELENELNQVVRGDEKDKVEFVIKALAEALEDEEDAREGDKAYAAWVAGGRKTRSFDEVMQSCGL